MRYPDFLAPYRQNRIAQRRHLIRKSVSFRLDPELLDKVDLAAYAWGCNRTCAFEAILLNFFKETPSMEETEIIKKEEIIENLETGDISKVDQEILELLKKKKSWTC